MELGGAIAALRHVADQPGPVAIYTDSTYVIQGITQWVWGWRKRGWKTAQGADVLNRELWEELSSLAGARARGGWTGAGCAATSARRATSAATKSRWRSRCSSRRNSTTGRSADYPLPILQLPDDTALPKRPRRLPARRPRPPRTRI